MPQGSSHTSKMLGGIAAQYRDELEVDVMYLCRPGFDASLPARRNDPLAHLPGRRCYLLGQQLYFQDGPMDLEAYEHVVFQSIGDSTAALVGRVFSPERIDVLITDDELDGRRRFYEMVAQYPHQEAELRARIGFSPAVERAFEQLQHFVAPRTPWQQLLELRREAPLTMLDVLVPFQSYAMSAVDTQKPPGLVRIAMAQKPTDPSLLRSAVAQLAELFGAHPTLRFQVLVFGLEKWPKFQLFDAALTNVSQVTLDTPITESAYWNLLLGCDALLLNSRGGLGGLLRALTHRVGVVDLWEGPSYNRECVEGLGATLQQADDLARFLSTGRRDAAQLERNARVVGAKLSEGTEFILQRYLC
ncbi:hypothetical protein ACG02S_08165 [Roseateles sp. DC23W]|uniref:Glycosyl transferases group 1 n=1 Tax=Pelomonas dachongensis TaxID=3299029 RepID=A0ABW7EL30_9BURK